MTRQRARNRLHTQPPGHAHRIPRRHGAVDTRTRNTEDTPKIHRRNTVQQVSQAEDGHASNDPERRDARVAGVAAPLSSMLTHVDSSTHRCSLHPAAIRMDGVASSQQRQVDKSGRHRCSPRCRTAPFGTISQQNTASDWARPRQSLMACHAPAHVPPHARRLMSWRCGLFRHTTPPCPPPPPQASATPAPAPLPSPSSSGQLSQASLCPTAPSKLEANGVLPCAMRAANACWPDS